MDKVAGGAQPLHPLTAAGVLEDAAGVFITMNCVEAAGVVLDAAGDMNNLASKGL